MMGPADALSSPGGPMVRIVLGVVLLVVALGLIGCGLYLRRAKRRIRRRLGDTSRSMTVAHPRDGLPYGMVDLPGTITSPATLTAPVTGSPCVMWELTVFSVRETEDGPSYTPVWITGRTGDVTMGSGMRTPGAAGYDGVPATGRMPATDPSEAPVYSETATRFADEHPEGTRVEDTEGTHERRDTL